MTDAQRQQVHAAIRAAGMTPHKSDQIAGMQYSQALQLNAAGNNPEVQRLIASGGSGTVNKVHGDTDVRVVNGKVTHLSTGGVWKPIMAAALVAGTAGAASAFAPATAIAPTAGGGSSLTAAPLVGGAYTGGATAATATGATLGGGGSLLGTLGTYGKAAGDIGELASGASSGLQEGRLGDNLADLHAASQNNRALVDAAQFNRDLPMTRAQQTARGDLMASPMQDASSTGSGRDIQFTGGVRPSSFGAATTQAGEELRRQALAKLMDPEADKLTPQLSTPRQAGAAENITGAVGTGLSILGAYNNYRKGR